jgi:hypothetical protein
VIKYIGGGGAAKTTVIIIIIKKKKNTKLNENKTIRRNEQKSYK